MQVSLKATSGMVTNPMINPKAGDSGPKTVDWVGRLFDQRYSLVFTTTEETLT